MRPRHLPRCLAASAAAALAVGLLPMGSASADVETISFDCTGGARSWVVPDGVTSATFELWGAEGGATDPVPGGLGGHVKASMAVTPGETFQLNVGCAGADGFNTANGGGGDGGFPDGGDGGDPLASQVNALGGAGGGGSSDVRRGGTTIADRVLVAGGGGGAGAALDSLGGGAGGGTAGDDGADNANGSSTGGGGANGTTGGTAGTPDGVAAVVKGDTLQGFVDGCGTVSCTYV